MLNNAIKLFSVFVYCCALPLLTAGKKTKSTENEEEENKKTVFLFSSCLNSKHAK